MDQQLASGLLLLIVVAALDVWVYLDARARQGTSREVSVTIGSLRIDRAELWAALCLVLFVVCFPLYLIARRAAT